MKKPMLAGALAAVVITVSGCGNAYEAPVVAQGKNVSGQSISDLVGINPLCISDPAAPAPAANFQPSSVSVANMGPSFYPNANVSVSMSPPVDLKIKLVPDFRILLDWTQQTVNKAGLIPLKVGASVGTPPGSYYVDIYYTNVSTGLECKGQPLWVRVFDPLKPSSPIRF